MADPLGWSPSWDEDGLSDVNQGQNVLDKIENITERDLGWLAGWLDGEGSFSAHSVADGRSSLIQVKATSTDKDVLIHVQDVAGGYIYGPRWPSEKATKACWAWQVTAGADAIALMNVLRPLMGERRQAQIDICLAAWEAKETIAHRDKTHCQHGHPLSGDNLYLWNGHRYCKICRDAASKRSNARAKARRDEQKALAATA